MDRRRVLAVLLASVWGPMSFTGCRQQGVDSSTKPTAELAHPFATRDDASRRPRPTGDALPGALKGVGVDEHLGSHIPMNLDFVDERGHSMRLREAFEGDVPVIITLNYSDCPMLCSLELNGLVRGLKGVDLGLGDSYRAVTVSLNPKETPARARKTQRRYLSQYGQAHAAGWHFLTGTEHNIRSLARTIGFNYRYDPERGQYYHAAAIAIASPRGKLVRYLYGIDFAPETLKLALIEASQGKIGSTVDRLILFCCAYDPKEGSYSWVASRLVTLSGLVILLAVAGSLVVLWRREVRRRRQLP